MAGVAVEASFRDYDFHPSEAEVRVSSFRSEGVLRADESVFASEAYDAGVVLRHYAFHDRWFKINVTTDRDGQVVETSPSPGVPAFAFNCSMATPMRCGTDAVYAVDLDADVLIRADARTYAIRDLDALVESVRLELISPAEAQGAVCGLADLLDLVERGRLVDVLHEAYPFGSSASPPAPPVDRVPLITVPEVQPGMRPTWSAPRDFPEDLESLEATLELLAGTFNS